MKAKKSISLTHAQLICSKKFMHIAQYFEVSQDYKIKTTLAFISFVLRTINKSLKVGMSMIEIWI